MILNCKLSFMRRFFFLIILLFPAFVFAQVEGRKLVPPNAVREADVSFSKRVWRVIDLREKQNKKAVWPGAPINKILYDAAVNGKLIPYLSDSLKSKLSVKQFLSIGSDTIFQETQIDPNDPTITKPDTLFSPFDPIENIRQLMILEDWLFDKKLSTMTPRIIAIAPLYRGRALGIDLGLQPLCWFKYDDLKKSEPTCRDLFIKIRMFNKENSHSTFTFDDWFEQRQFGSYIVKSSNIDNVSILQDEEVKKNGLEALIKAERLKKENFDYEAGQFED